MCMDFLHHTTHFTCLLEHTQFRGKHTLCWWYFFHFGISSHHGRLFSLSLAWLLSNFAFILMWGNSFKAETKLMDKCGVCSFFIYEHYYFYGTLDCMCSMLSSYPTWGELCISCREITFTSLSSNSEVSNTTVLTLPPSRFLFPTQNS